jgi:hypothetical protein
VTAEQKRQHVWSNLGGEATGEIDSHFLNVAKDLCASAEDVRLQGIPCRNSRIEGLGEGKDSLRIVSETPTAILTM